MPSSSREVKISGFIDNELFRNGSPIKTRNTLKMNTVDQVLAKKKINDVQLRRHRKSLQAEWPNWFKDYLLVQSIADQILQIMYYPAYFNISNIAI